jgi:tetratricopeptide (TPR) repeat protein
MRRTLPSLLFALLLGVSSPPPGIAGAPDEDDPAAAAAAEREQELRGALAAADRLLADGDPEEAREQYERAMPMLPRDQHPQVLRQLARTYYESGDRRGAVAQLEQALAIDAEDPDALALMVSLLAEQGRVGEAQAYARRLPEGKSLDTSASLNMGLALQRSGDPRGAFAQFDRAVREHPREADVYYYRAQAALALGDAAAARADFETLVALAPGHAKAREARALIESLRARSP